MTDKEIDELLERVSNKFEELVNSGMKFRKESLNNLSGWTKRCVREMVESHGWEWEIGETQVEGCVLVRTNHPKLKYLDIFPPIRMFMWCKDGHHEAIHPDEALILAFAGSKSKMKVLEDRSVEVETEDGYVIVVPHPHEH